MVSGGGGTLGQASKGGRKGRSVVAGVVAELEDCGGEV
jgi:hypothetical protein